MALQRTMEENDREERRRTNKKKKEEKDGGRSQKKDRQVPGDEGVVVVEVEDQRRVRPLDLRSTYVHHTVQLKGFVPPEFKGIRDKFAPHKALKF